MRLVIESERGKKGLELSEIPDKSLQKLLFGVEKSRCLFKIKMFLVWYNKDKNTSMSNKEDAYFPFM